MDRITVHEYERMYKHVAIAIGHVETCIGIAKTVKHYQLFSKFIGVKVELETLKNWIKMILEEQVEKVYE